MNRYIYLSIFLLFLTCGMGSQSFAATIAEASIGNERATVGKYDLSGMTEEERKWFTTFLNGNFFADGWEEISVEILENTTVHEREQQQAHLHKLGFKIGSEWSKPNDIRKISTDDLRHWGKQLKDTAENSPHLLSEVLHRINSEVDNLIN